MKDSTLLALVAAGAIFLLFTSSRQQSGYVIPPGYVPPNIPPQPPPQTVAWQQWAQSLINLYGSIDSLFKPGGPFYNPNDAQLKELQDSFKYAYLAFP